MSAWVLTLHGRPTVTVVDRLKRYEDVTKTFFLNIMVQLRSPSKIADTMLSTGTVFMLSTLKSYSGLCSARQM
jgi:hypothetical protein